MSAKKKSAAEQPVKARLYKNRSKTAEAAPYLMTVIDSAGATHQLSLSLVKSLYAQSTAPAGIAAGQASLVLTLTDAANNTFTVSRKVTVV